MNKHRMIRIGFALAMVAVPFYLQAGTKQAGLEACAEAMVGDLASSQGAPMVYNLNPDARKDRGRLHRREVFHLDALDPKDDAVIARVDCVVNHKAEVTRLIPVPLEGEDARVRATTFNDNY